MYSKAKNKRCLWQDYVKVRNECNALIKEGKRKFFKERITKFRNESKTLWSLLNHAIKKRRNKTSLPKEIRINGIDVTDTKQISNAFAEHYSSIGMKYAEKLRQNNVRSPDVIRHIKKVNNSIYLYPTHDREIEKIADKLKAKNSSGIDNISNKLVKAIIPCICDTLVTLINTCMSEGKFPKIFKTAVVIPLYKGKDKREINNYRPISLLSCISKIFEKVILHRMVSFAQKENLLYEGQYGFRTNRSTTDACLDYIGNIINSLENNMYVFFFFRHV